MDQQPEGREVGVEIIAENLGQVDLDPGRTGQNNIVAEKTQREAVGNNAPEAVLIRVEVFLQ